MIIKSDPNIKLYELVLENGRSSSPFVWRVRYALAHKGLPFELVPLGFVDIPKTFNGACKTVPVLTYGEVTLTDSWDIAEHLDAAFPGTPALFSNPAEIAMVRLFDAWFAPTVMRWIFMIRQGPRIALIFGRAARRASKVKPWNK